MNDALQPGLWAMLVCMDQEQMRVLNATLTDDEREIWRRLYGEWEAYGKWKG